MSANSRKNTGKGQTDALCGVGGWYIYMCVCVRKFEQEHWEGAGRCSLCGNTAPHFVHSAEDNANTVFYDTAAVLVHAQMRGARQEQYQDVSAGVLQLDAIPSKRTRPAQYAAYRNNASTLRS